MKYMIIVYFGKGGDDMAVCFFLTVFCGIVGAYVLAKEFYRAVIRTICTLGKRKVRKCPKQRKNL